MLSSRLGVLMGDLMVLLHVHLHMYSMPQLSQSMHALVCDCAGIMVTNAQSATTQTLVTCLL